MPTNPADATPKLTGLMDVAAKDLLLSLERIRAAYSHNLTIGEQAEDVLRKFLNAHLPDSIGIANGQIVDSLGQESRQVDVILYDKGRTPVLYTNEEQGTRLVPVEGVIGVIEVKACVTGSDIPDVVTHMQSIKRLTKRAFHPTNPARPTFDYTLYGQRQSHFPIIYSLFAFSASSPENMLEAFDKYNAPLPVHERVDNACLLGTGVLTNKTGETYSGVPNPASHHGFSMSTKGLLLWFLLNSNLWLQAEVNPINLVPYIGETSM